MGWDAQNPGKSPSTVYDPQFLPGTIAISGSVSSYYDLAGWTLIGLQIVGTPAAGTISFLASNWNQGVYSPVYDTAGNKLTVLATVGNQIVTDIPELAPLRYIQLVTAGTQSVAQVINLLVK